MTTNATETQFSGSVPRVYQDFLVPLLFEPYAADLTARVVERAPTRVLELAAGTGVVTRHLAARLPAATDIVATDLNGAMLEVASSLGTARPVAWREADAMALPFDDGGFDAVVCQFGVMFFPDKARAFAEARRVLAPGGLFLFNVWDAIAVNELTATVSAAVAALFPDLPPRFFETLPHGYHVPETIARDLRAGAFAAAPRIDTVDARSRAGSARAAAVALCQGTPLRSEIEARGATALEDATAAAEAAIAARFGAGPVDAGMRAHVVAVER